MTHRPCAIAVLGLITLALCSVIDVVGNQFSDGECEDMLSCARDVDMDEGLGSIDLGGFYECVEMNLSNASADYFEYRANRCFNRKAKEAYAERNTCVLRAVGRACYMKREFRDART